MATRRQWRPKVSKTYGALTRSQPKGASHPHRPALATLHPNSRSTTYMAKLTRSKSDALSDGPDPIPRKRKRLGSPASRSRAKRRRSNPNQQSEPIDDGGPTSTEPAETDEGEHSADENAGQGGQSDEFLLQTAAAWQLNRLRKEDLVRLHDLIRLTKDPESFNKSLLVNMLLEYRASQSSTRSSASSSGSAVPDEADFETPHPKRTRSVPRRATENYPPSPNSHRIITTRSTSLGNATSRLPEVRLETRRRLGLVADTKPYEPSPRKTRARAKQLASNITEARHSKNQFPIPETSGESDQPSSRTSQRSPRRLRQRKTSGCSVSSKESGPSVPTIRRRYPRKARYNGSLQEDSTEDTEEGERGNDQSDDEGGGELLSEDASEDIEGSTDEEEDMDLDHRSSAFVDGRTTRNQRRTRSISQSAKSDISMGSRTARKRRGDSKSGIQECTTNSDEDGDDEDEGDEESITTDLPAVHVLRNGKVVGEMVNEVQEEDELESDQIEADEVEEDEEDIELDDDDLDMNQQTRKTLLRHKRDDLVRLCEANGIEADGTKKQLAQALLEWRDSQNHFPSSSTAPPSSSQASTERPYSSRKVPRRTKACTPVLLRNGYRVHISPRPPTIVPESKRNKDKDEDIELDLGSLGLVDREIPPHEITKLEKIGSGGFKDVYIGKYRNRKVAISEFRDTLNSMDIKELKLLHEFDHPNVVHFYGVSIPEDTRSSPVMIISELCPNGDLFDYLRNVPPPSLRRVLSLMLDIARGLEYLHLRNPSVIHRDCKSSNILITAKINAKITDFGLAKVKQSTRSMVKSLVGTVNWQAPELWSPQPKYDHKVDVFSCAMVYWEMLQWHGPRKMYPWEGMNEHAIYDAVGAKKQRPSITGLRKQWCPEIVDLMETMWSQDSRDRPTITQVVQEIERIVRAH